MKNPSGVVSAMLTPFTANGKLDFVSMEKLVQYYQKSGLTGLFINGTTGEGLYLSPEEKYEILKFVKHQTKGKLELYACCIQPSTRQTIADIELMQDLDPDYFVAVPPLYYGADQEMIYQHFLEISSACPGPLIIYNFPHFTGKKIEFQTVKRLSEVENIVGIKDSSGDFQQFVTGVNEPSEAKFSWMQGDDLLHCSSLQSGAAGIVTGLGNVSIKYHVALYNAHLQGNSKLMWRNQQRLNQLYKLIIGTEKGISTIKAATSILGRCETYMKEGWMNLSKSETGKVESILRGFGIKGAVE